MWIKPVSEMLDPLLTGMLFCCCARSDRFQSPLTVK